MKRFRHLFLSVILLFSFSLAVFSQTISGKVSNSKNGESLPGVSIILKGTNTGTTSDGDGNFKIPVAPGSTIVFSYVGFLNKEITVGNQTQFNIQLDEDTKNLSEIVVTALGIKKDAKKLGYATSTVSSDALAQNRQPNFMNSLQGKVAGVNVQGMGTGPGGSSKIRIRGQSSITGQNSPLIVINGVPIDNTNFGANQNNAGSDASIGVRGGGGVFSDGGDGLSSINPDDIESMTILKGATAAALYGSRAKDGVIMITTKTKGEGKGIGVTFNTNFTSEKALDFTDYQYEYGQGENGVRPTTANPTSGQWSFGEKFAPGMTQVLFDGVTVPYEPIRNRYDIFYRPGQNWTNTVSLSGSDSKGGFNLSFANMDSKGIIPNNSFNRKTINLGLTYNLSKKLSLSSSMNYSNEKNTNPPNIANQDNSIPTSVAILANSMPWDLLDAKKYDASGNEFVYSRFRNRTNPYFVLAKQFHNIDRDRIFGNIALKYQLTDWLSLQGRIGQDYWSRDEDYNNFPTGQASLGPAPAGFVNGRYTQDARRFREINKDILLSGTKQFNAIGLDFSVGGNQMTRRSDLNSVQVVDFVVRDLYTIMNGRVKDPIYDLQERAVNSVYGSAELSYKDFLFLNGTARNDWFSTLSPANRSILYPSVSGSFVFSQAMNSSPDWLSFGKLRLAYAEVGSDTDVPPYANALFYGINANLFNNQPVGASQGTTVPNANLRPMRVAEKEAGIELKLFKNKVGFDFAIYDKITTDQIVSAQVSDASGFVTTLINSGKSQARGFEWLLSLNPVSTNNFRWDINFNGSYNKTKLLSLQTNTPGERITTGTHVFNGELRQVVGQELGQIYGFGFRRDNNGNKIFGSNGLPLRTPDQISFGSALPNWIGGITNNFNYKGISLSALIDFSLGGNMLSGTNFNLVRHGLHKMSLEGRDTGGVVGVGVNEKGEVNTTIAPVQQYWEVVRSQALVEPVIYNSGFWKLRQLSIGYDLSKYIPKNLNINGVRLNLISNNVLMLKKWIPNIDPDSFGFTSDNIVGLESSGVPTTRSIGFNLNVKF